MHDDYLAHLRRTVDAIRADGFYKAERVIESPQSSQIRLSSGAEVLNFCANNYLGLANDPRLIAAAREGLEHWGFGMASVRFICGTQAVHKELERAISAFLGTDDSILYSSCFDANGGVFETLLGEEDAVISDELNHASIVDGIRLCKAKRFRYRNNDMADLETRLSEAEAARFITEALAAEDLAGKSVLLLIPDGTRTAPVPLVMIVTNFEDGVGSTLKEVGLLIALGAMLGKLLADSGGADQVIDKRVVVAA